MAGVARAHMEMAAACSCAEACDYKRGPDKIFLDLGSSGYPPGTLFLLLRNPRHVNNKAGEI